MKKKNDKIFKPRRMLFDGKVYNVDSLHTLNMIKDDIKNKKEESLIEQEETKNQKYLVKRTISKDKNAKDVITKILVNPSVQRPNDVKSIPKKNDVVKTKLVIRQPGSNKVVSNVKKETFVVRSHGLKVTPVEETKIFESAPTDSAEHENDVKKSNLVQENNVKKSNLVQESSVKKLVQESSVKRLSSEKKLVVKSRSRGSEIVVSDKKESNDNYFTSHHDVREGEWYELILRTTFVNEYYVKLIVKVFDMKKQLILPLIKISNNMFFVKKYDNNTTEYKVYIWIPDGVDEIDTHCMGITVYNAVMKHVDIDIVNQNIDLWNYRKLYDLEFINYYMSKCGINSAYSEKFINRFNAEYELFKNPNYFEDYIEGLSLETEYEKDDNVLYLVHTSIEYENYGYTVRTQNLMKHYDGKYNIICCTRYGYPYDREIDYYHVEPKNEYECDGVRYIKLLNGKENYNTMNILEYLKKYLCEVIKLCVERKVKIIHATTNYWNGIVGVMAAKYLGIKCVYEIRELWGEVMTILKPELKNSDIVKMMTVQEKIIFDKVDNVIVLDEKQKSSDKIQVLHYGVTVNEDDERDKLIKKHGLKGFILGYIGSINQYDGIEYVLQCMKKINDVMFVIIGDGQYKNVIVEHVKNLGLTSRVVMLGQIDNAEAIKYYSVFDACVYPKKKCDLCGLKLSYKIIEAFAHSKAVITSNNGGNVGGLLYEADNIDDLCDKFKMVVNDDELRLRLGNEGKKWIEENRDWSNICISLDKIYDEL